MGDYPSAARAAQEALKRDKDDAVAQTVLSLSEGRAASGQGVKGIPSPSVGAQPKEVTAGWNADSILPVKPPVKAGRRSVLVPSIGSDSPRPPMLPASDPGSSPLLPIGAAAGIGLASYGVLRPKQTWSRREDLGGNAVVDPEDDAYWKRHAQAVMASAAIGAAVAFGGPWVLPRIGAGVAAAWRYAAPSFQRVVQSEFGAVHPSGSGNFKNLAPSGRINPFAVRFSQSSISNKLRDAAGNKSAQTVDELAADLVNGKVMPDVVPPVRLVMRDGRLFALDNRRLEAFRRAKMEVPYRMATAEEAELAAKHGKFSTLNDGMSVRIRGE
jgi:hypothetical protein